MPRTFSSVGDRVNQTAGSVGELVAHQATFARFVNSCSAWSWALRLRQAM
jgi:hypothetical protein